MTLRVDDCNPGGMDSAQSYPDLKFYNDSNMFRDWLRLCKEQYKQDDCNHSYTSLTHQDTSVAKGLITINLTPYLYLSKPFDEEDSLTVANRISSFLVIFMGASVKELFTVVISAYCLNLVSLHKVQLLNRLFQLALSLLFLLHFGLLFYSIVYHPLMETSTILQATEIEPLATFRFCFPSKVNLESNDVKVEDLNSKTLDFPEFFENILIFDDDNEISTNLSISDFKPEYATHLKHPCSVWTARKNKRIIHTHFLYHSAVKCYTFSVSSLKNKTERNLNVHYHRLQKIFTISFSLRNLNESRKKEGHSANFQVFFNRKNLMDFDWNKKYDLGEYEFEISTANRRFRDDFWYIKNPVLSLASLLGLSISIDDPIAYLENLRDSFINEQYATTNLLPLYPGDKRDFKIKNRQFNYYIQFRSIATRRNKYDFTKNTEKLMIKNTVYLRKRTNKTDKISLSVNASPLKFQEISRNRYRFVELFLHLFTLISFWFKVDFITFPTSLKNAYPVFKYFVVYFLFYVVDFLIRLFNLWFALVRFLKFKND